MEEKKISIIIPVYNVEEYLRECLDSVLGQTFQSIEIICVNDASTDNSLEILRAYQAIYSNISILSHEKNSGLSAARNTGLEKASGKYVMFVDSDDMILTNACEELYQMAEKYKTDIIYFNMKLLNEKGDRSWTQNVKYNNHTEVLSGKEMFCNFVEEKGRKEQVWRQFFNRDFLGRHHISFYEGILHEDNLFSFLTAMKAERVFDINKEYYLYRQRAGSIMSAKSNKRAESVFLILNEMYFYWHTHEFSEREHKAIAALFHSLFRKFFQLRKDCDSNTQLMVGSYAEKLLYSLLDEKYKKYFWLSEEQLERLRCAKYIIVYGAGVMADEVFNELGNRNIKIDSVAVSKLEGNPKVFHGIDVKVIDELSAYKEKAEVIIGVNEKYVDEIKYNLRKYGFKKLIKLEYI